MAGTYICLYSFLPSVCLCFTLSSFRRNWIAYKYEREERQRDREEMEREREREQFTCTITLWPWSFPWLLLQYSSFCLYLSFRETVQVILFTGNQISYTDILEEFNFVITLSAWLTLWSEHHKFYFQQKKWGTF